MKAKIKLIYFHGAVRWTVTGTVHFLRDLMLLAPIKQLKINLNNFYINVRIIYI